MNPTPEKDPCGPGKLQIAPTRSTRIRTEIPGPVARDWLARHAKIEPAATEDPRGTVATPEVFPIVPQKAHGTLVYDVDGNVFIDFSGRAGVTGYTPDHLLDTLRDGVENLIGFPGYTTNPAAIQLSEKLLSLVPGAEKVLLFDTMGNVSDTLHKIDPTATIDTDETRFGFGRTGKFWLHPEADALVLYDFAAGLPISAVVGKAALLDRIGHLGTGASPLACAAALSVINYILDNDLPRRALQIEQRIKEEIASWGHADAVAGAGVMGFVWVDSLEKAKHAYHKARQNGLILAGWANSRLRYEIPLMCPEEQLNEALDILRDALDW
jgi:4-aminobutyrate aminotransferase-like enzyme